MKTKITLLSLFLVLGLSIHTQNLDEKKINDAVKNIPYVFEGEVIDYEVYAGDHEGNRLAPGVFTLQDGSKAIGFVSVKVQVCKIYKGKNQLKHGTIEIITSSKYLNVFPGADSTTGSAVAYTFVVPEHGISQEFFLKEKGLKYIFFCTLPKYPGKSQISFDNSIGVYPDPSLTVLYNWWNTRESDPYAWNSLKVFGSQAELTSFISKIEGLNTKAENFCEDKGQGQLPSTPDGIEPIDYQTRLDNYTAWLNFKQSYKPKKNMSKDVNATALTLELSNPSISGTSPTDKYFEFDIVVYASDNTTYFDNCLIRLQYNASAFGTNVVANNNIVITRGTLYDNTTYTNPNTDVIDQTGNTLGIPMGTDYMQSSWNRTAVTIFPEILMHVKMKIQTCNQLSGFNYTDISLTSNFSFYAITANANIVDTYSYDLTNYYGTINDATCIPQITSFSDYVPAGTGATLTITGNYFGQAMGTAGTVVFKNANAGNSYPPGTGIKKGGIQYYDVISWTDDEIQIRLPSIIDSVPLPPPALTGNVNPVPGSGKFKVVNFTDNGVESPYGITIPYAINQSIYAIFPTYDKKRIHLIDQNGQDGYTIHCTPAIETHMPGAKNIIRKALRDWSCVSGINWQLGNDTTLSKGKDGVCIIDTISFSNNVLQYTDLDVRYCPSTLQHILSSLDIGIAIPVSWQVDTTGNLIAGNEDFYNAVAHELGHGHLLKHINDSLGDIMFYLAAPGPLLSAQRKRVWLSPGAMNGAIWVTSNSITALTCADMHVLNYPSDCTGLSVAENETGINISSFPNPVSDGFVTIRFDLNQESRTRLVLYDELGRMLKATQELKTAGSISEMIYVGDLANGSYYIHVIINDVPHTVKLIKN